MKEIRWNLEKNAALKKKRGISFEEVLAYLLADEVLDVIEHPNQTRYPGQMIYILGIGEQVCLVPFVETEDEVFLKTIIPSRKAKRRYGG